MSADTMNDGSDLDLRLPQRDDRPFIEAHLLRGAYVAQNTGREMIAPTKAATEDRSRCCLPLTRQRGDGPITQIAVKALGYGSIQAALVRRAISSSFND
jgi:hypothetical protein